MCPGSCAVYLCADCRFAAHTDKVNAELFKARSAELETELATWKRKGLESDALAMAASRFEFGDYTAYWTCGKGIDSWRVRGPWNGEGAAEHIAGPKGVTRMSREEAIALARELGKTAAPETPTS